MRVGCIDKLPVLSDSERSRWTSAIRPCTLRPTADDCTYSGAAHTRPGADAEAEDRLWEPFSGQSHTCTHDTFRALAHATGQRCASPASSGRTPGTSLRATWGW